MTGRNTRIGVWLAAAAVLLGMSGVASAAVFSGSKTLFVFGLADCTKGAPSAQCERAAKAAAAARVPELLRLRLLDQSEIPITVAARDNRLKVHVTRIDYLHRQALPQIGAYRVEARAIVDFWIETSLPPATVWSGGTMQVRSQSNVRTGPSTKARKIGTVEKDTVLWVRPARTRTDWLEALLPDGRTGYIYAKLLVPAKAAGADPRTTVCDRGAADPWDPYKTAAGVDIEALERQRPATRAKTVTACRASLAGKSASVRLRYQLARLLLAGNKGREGLSLLRRAAKADYSAAQVLLGRLYETGGHGVKRDRAKARALFETVAKKDYPVGIRALRHYHRIMGNNYHFAKPGFAKDEAKAVGHYRKAAELGDGYSLAKVANAYLSGVGAKKDIKRAVRLFHYSAEYGYALSMEMIAYMHETLWKQTADGWRWRVRGAEEGSFHGQWNLGASYAANGDNISALKWLLIAENTRKAAGKPLTPAQQKQIDTLKKKVGLKTMGSIHAEASLWSLKRSIR